MISAMARTAFADHRAAFLGLIARGDRELVGLARVVRVLLDRGGHLFHRGGGLFERGGLLLGALRQIRVARRRSPRRRDAPRRRALHAADDLRHVVGELVDAARQGLEEAALAVEADALAQVAGQHRGQHALHFFFHGRLPACGPSTPSRCRCVSRPCCYGVGDRAEGAATQRAIFHIATGESIQLAPLHTRFRAQGIEAGATQPCGVEAGQSPADLVLSARECGLGRVVQINDVVRGIR